MFVCKSIIQGFTNIYSFLLPIKVCDYLTSMLNFTLIFITLFLTAFNSINNIKTNTVSQRTSSNAFICKRNKAEFIQGTKLKEVFTKTAYQNISVCVDSFEFLRVWYISRDYTDDLRVSIVFSSTGMLD
jgi:hypothetical protein